MAELTPSERLQPCLLDRLTDDHPNDQKESRDQRQMTIQRYRQAVLRDLAWLLNACSHPAEDGLDEFEEVPSSVLNYGIRDVTGLSATGFELRDMERALTQAIRDFEPRILPETVSIRSSGNTSQMSLTAVSFEINGDLWAQPLPEALYIKTELDLETGQCKLK